MVKTLSVVLALLAALAAEAQSGPKLHRIGVIYAGGPYEAVLQGMRAGLVESGLAEGKHFVLHVRDTKGRRRVIVFYDPDNSTARDSMALAREAAAKLRIELVERRVASVEEVIAGVRALQPGEVDAYFLVGDAMVTSATPAVMDLARERRLPLIVQDLKLVEAGALAAYGADYFDVGRMAAKHVRLVLAGTRPQ